MSSALRSLLRFLLRLLRRLLLLLLLRVLLLRLRAILLTVHRSTLSSRRAEKRNALTDAGIFCERHKVKERHGLSQRFMQNSKPNGTVS